ncbi:type II toxin-antitoxin system VapC family toxin [Variovorax sp. RA8]|uniref:type II toxin-antitoxin system VapC family toxin n=1 Tax=Variovorax sp. (strain JCM 16519 / RA8) TaxID=662548 RepID=UPI001315C047|nr:VapC toxin family PIN domain ribonuclease [Variovorax sp. RA8]VTU42043.1 putative ribonuclease VapC32 [Variovorax sp. RA8]
MSVLVDTSVWIDHFRSGNAALAHLVGLDLALTHPMVVVELACGTPPTPREHTLGGLSLLRTCNQATLNEVQELVERERLYGLGCGLVDMALLASTLITPGARLWTLDRRLLELAQRFDVAHGIH